MKLAIEIILSVFVLIVLISQVLLPMFSSKWKFFWILDPKPVEIEETPAVGTLSELAKETKTVSKQVKQTKKKIDSAEKQLSEIKSQI